MLKEAGADTVWLQEVMVPHWTRGAKEEAQLIMADGTKKPLKVTALGNSVGTPAGGIRANVIEVRTMDELKQLGVKGYLRKPFQPEAFRAVVYEALGIQHA